MRMSYYSVASSIMLQLNHISFASHQKLICKFSITISSHTQLDTYTRSLQWHPSHSFLCFDAITRTIFLLRFYAITQPLFDATPSIELSLCVDSMPSFNVSCFNTITWTLYLHLDGITQTLSLLWFDAITQTLSLFSFDAITRTILLQCHLSLKFSSLRCHHLNVLIRCNHSELSLAVMPSLLVSLHFDSMSWLNISCFNAITRSVTLPFDAITWTISFHFDYINQTFWFDAITWTLSCCDAITQPLSSLQIDAITRTLLLWCHQSNSLASMPSIKLSLLFNAITRTLSLLWFDAITWSLSLLRCHHSNSLFVSIWCHHSTSLASMTSLELSLFTLMPSLELSLHFDSMSWLNLSLLQCHHSLCRSSLQCHHSNYLSSLWCHHSTVLIRYHHLNSILLQWHHSDSIFASIRCHDSTSLFALIRCHDSTFLASMPSFDRFDSIPSLELSKLRLDAITQTLSCFSASLELSLFPSMPSLELSLHFNSMPSLNLSCFDLMPSLNLSLPFNSITRTLSLLWFDDITQPLFALNRCHHSTSLCSDSITRTHSLLCFDAITRTFSFPFDAITRTLSSLQFYAITQPLLLWCLPSTSLYPSMPSLELSLCFDSMASLNLSCFDAISQTLSSLWCHHSSNTFNGKATI